MNRVITPLLCAIFQSLNTSNIFPNDQYSVMMMEGGGFYSMTFTQSNFSNMRRDNRQNICGHNANLLIEHMNERRKKELDFYFSFTKHEDGTYHDFRSSFDIIVTL